MTIYVSELPKSCEKCKFYEHEVEYNGEWGIEKHRHICKINGSLIQGICPLQSLADYTKQVRKEVLGDLKEELKKNGKCSIRGNGTMDFFIEMNKLNQILDENEIKFEEE